MIFDKDLSKHLNKLNEKCFKIYIKFELINLKNRFQQILYITC
jgi:hypothetical protein